MPHHDPTPERYASALSGELHAANGYRMEFMAHKRDYELNGSKTLYPPEQVGLPDRDANGNQLKVVGEIAVPATETEFLRAVVVKHSSYDGKSFHRIIALDEAIEEDERTKVVAAREEIPGLTIYEGALTIGRDIPEGEGMSPAQAIWGAAFVEASTKRMSRQHLTVEAREGKLLLSSVASQGTYIAMDVPKVSEKIRSVYTSFGLQEAQREKALLEDGYSGRHKKLDVLNRDKPVVDGSVDLRAYGSGREANVVDSTDSRYEREYEILYGALRRHLAEVRKSRRIEEGHAPGEFTDADVMRAAYDAVREVMKYDLKQVNAIIDREIMNSGSRDINLGVFMREGTGICRHMGLAAAWVLNHAAERGLLSRRSSAVSAANSIPEKRTGHEWARYIGDDGEIYIVDPAYEYVGPLRDVPGLEAKGHPLWDEYFSSVEEREYYTKLYQERLSMKDKVVDGVVKAARKLIG